MRILFVDNHPELTSTAMEHYQASTFDVVLADYDLDDGKGDRFVRWLRAFDAGNAALVAAGATAVCAKIELARIEAVLGELG